MRIVLMGYMGCGKTTIGKLLAKELSHEFIDMDFFIERDAGCSISEIFEIEGESGFRVIERKVLRMLLKKKNVVIAAGGGTPCFFDNMKLINEKGFSIYLKVSAEKLHKRLTPVGMRRNRPLLRNFSSGELLNYIRAGLNDRETFYREANCVYRIGEKDLKKIVAEIIPVLDSIKKLHQKN